MEKIVLKINICTSFEIFSLFMSTIFCKKIFAICGPPYRLINLNWCIAKLMPTITDIINMSLRDSLIPKSRKTALIRPLLKKTGLDSDILKNYRPVSNLTFISKVNEEVVSVRLNEHLIRNSIFDPLQLVYRDTNSTETALIKVQNEIVSALDAGSSAILLMLELSVAFDTIDHDILFSRLCNVYGITGDALDWFRSYLTGRT